MMKRLTWFVGGAAIGALGAGRAKRKVRTVAAELAPAQVVRRTSLSVRGGLRNASAALREGRLAMRAREAELRARLDGRAVSLADHVQDGDEVIVNGMPVEAADVVVLRRSSVQHGRLRR